MAKKKTSAELAKEQSEIAKVEGMLGDAFGSLGGLEQTTQEENDEMITDSPSEEIDASPQNDGSVSSDDEVVDEQTSEEKTTPPLSNPPSGPPSGPPSKPPSSPPSGPPSKPPSGPPSGPPSKPPSSPPSGPPSKPPTDPPMSPSVEQEDMVTPPSSPPSEPPSKPPSGPPSKPPSKPLSVSSPISDEKPEDLPASETVDETNQDKTADEVENDGPDSEDTEESPDKGGVTVKEEVDEKAETTATETEKDVAVVDENSNEILEPPLIEMDVETTTDVSVEMGDIVSKEAEIARLSAEVERLRHSMTGAVDIIEELENPPMPPIVEDDVVIGAHIVADIARMARQLDRDELVRASMGAIAMLHPDRLDIVISTKQKTLLPRMNEKDICAGKLNSDPPRGAPTDWRVLEVLLASTSIVTGGPAAVLHCHGPYSTAVSCEKDLVLMQPIDAIGKEHIGKVIIVDPDEENPREYLRQVAEALNQGGMRCVVIRGNGAYAVGADLDQAWANAAMLEHSMKIIMLARQANLKI